MRAIRPTLPSSPAFSLAKKVGQIHVGKCPMKRVVWLKGQKL